jgi:hypothetical protein
MSNYVRRTKHPVTEEFEDAHWIDDYFGKHKYGVSFPSDDKIYRRDEYEWEFEDENKEVSVIALKGGELECRLNIAKAEAITDTYYNIVELVLTQAGNAFAKNDDTAAYALREFGRNVKTLEDQAATELGKARAALEKLLRNA